MKKRSFISWLLVWFVTQIVSLISVVLLFTLGLILVEFVLYPLALGVSALLVGLTAVWASNWLVKDNLESHMEAVIIRCEAAAVTLTLILIVANISGSLPTPPIIVASLVAVVLALVATVSAAKLRQAPQYDPQRKRRVVIWLLGALLAIPLVIFLASLFGWAGA